MIQSYVNGINLCADTDSSTGSGTIPKSDHSNNLINGVPEDDVCRGFTQLICDKIDTIANEPEEDIVKKKTHQGQRQKNDDSEVAAMFSMFRMKNQKRNSMHSQKSQKSRVIDSESNGSCYESEKHRRRHTQQCYRHHEVGHIPRYCRSTAPVERRAPTKAAADTPTETAAVVATTTTSIEDCLMIVTNRESPSKESCYWDYTTTSHICGNQPNFDWYTEHTKREEREIRNFAGKVAGKAIDHGDVGLMVRLPGGRRNELVVRNVLYVEGAHNSLAQPWLVDRDWPIVPVNGYGIKI